MIDLYDALFQYYEHDHKLALEALDGLSDNIKSNPKIISETIDDVVEENELCPDCYIEWETFISTHAHEHSEYMGADVEEEIFSKRCPNCGQINDD